MKKSVKILICILVLVLVAGGCIFAFTRDNYGIDKKADVVLITNGANVEDDYKTKGLWNGVKKYAKANKLKDNYIIPEFEENSSLDTARIGEFIEIAVNNGAKYIVLPDESFAVAAYEYAPTYKDVKFLLVDAISHSEGDDVMRTLSNVFSVKFNYNEAGFLAGYSAVQDGSTKLGFIGSTLDESTGPYAGGFKQGAIYAAEEKSVDITFDYAEYDSLLLDYDYSINAKPIYEPISEGAHKLNVSGGIGSGYYNEGQTVSIKADDAAKDKAFDHWEVKSDTEGIDDSKIVISDINNPNYATVTIGSGDCTITAVYKDVKTQEVTILNEKGEAYKVLNVPENTTVKVDAPMPQMFMTFVKWECNFNDALDDMEAKSVTVSVKDKPITLTPNYSLISNQVFKIEATDSVGSGVYEENDKVELIANAPQEGYMFSKWELTDVNGYKVVDDDKLNNPNLVFEMPNRYETLANKFIDNGVEIIFTNDSEITKGALEYAKNSGKGLVYSTKPSVDNMDSLNGYVEFDYENAVAKAFNDFVGGSIFNADVKSECIKLSNKSAKAKALNEKGKEIVDENYNEEYAVFYNGVANGKFQLVHLKTGADISKVNPSEKMKLNYWIIKG